MQRASLVEKSRQKPQDRMRTLTDVSFPQSSYVYSSYLGWSNIFAHLIWQALRSYSYDEDPVLAACGISIGKQLTQVDGRILEIPKVNISPPSFWLRNRKIRRVSFLIQTMIIVH